MKRLALAAALCLAALPAVAQSDPGWATGRIPTAAEWSAAFAGKVDTTNGTLNNPTLIGVTSLNAVFTTPTLITPTLSNPVLDGMFDFGTRTIVPNFAADGKGTSVSPFVSKQDITWNLTGGTAGVYRANNWRAVVSGIPPTTGTPEIWHSLDQFYAAFTGAAPVNAVARYTQSVRTEPALNSVLWGGVIETRDDTGLASSLGGSLLGLELDLVANGEDDTTGAGRAGLVITMANGSPAGIAPMEAKRAMSITTGGATAKGFYSLISIGAPFRDAGFDFRTSGPWTGAGVGTNNAIWLRGSQHIAFNTDGSVYAAWSGTALELAGGPVNNDTEYRIDGTKVVSNRRTGWTAASGTPTRTTFVTSTVTTEQLAEHVKALIDDLTSHGLIGP